MLVARAMSECHMYMDLHPCERCGEADFPWTVHEAAERAGQRISSYEGDCPSCGTHRRFEFVVLDPNLPPPGLGGPEPSTIIDPGGFFEVGEWAAGALKVAPDASPDEVADAYDAAIDAVATVEEILKFLPPGADSVPEEAFTSGRGHAIRAADTGRVERSRLEATLAERRRVLVDLTARVEALRESNGW
ncbi:hypothetical protein GCM10009557_89420 [Virgisporangium ochraceum]